MDDTILIVIAAMGPIGAGITALLALSGRFGKIEGKDRVSKATLEALRREIDNTNTESDKQAGDIRTVDKRLGELSQAQNLTEYIINETKELLKDSNVRLSKIELSLTQLRTYYDNMKVQDERDRKYGYDIRHNNEFDEQFKRREKDALGNTR